MDQGTGPLHKKSGSMGLPHCMLKGMLSLDMVSFQYAAERDAEVPGKGWLLSPPSFEQEGLSRLTIVNHSALFAVTPVPT